MKPSTNRSTSRASRCVRWSSAAGPRTSLRATGQRGSIAVMAVMFIAVAFILVESASIGYQFYLRRQVRLTADLAVLAGAQQLNGPDCTQAIQAIQSSVSKNLASATYVSAPSCGRWDSALYSSANNYYLPYTSNSPGAGQPDPNAVSVTLSASLPKFLPLLGGTSVQATSKATRAGSPIAVFSVGSNLVEINKGVVPGLLAAVGVNVSGTSLVSYKGLANVPIKMSGLLQALGVNVPVNASVGTLQSLLSVQTPTLASLLGAVQTVGGQQDLASILGLSVGSLNLPVRLGGDPTTGRGGLFSLDASVANGQSALDATVDALDLVNTAVLVANSQHALASNLTLAGINAQLQIIEPPSIGIGGIGAKAYNSQVRLFLDIESSSIPLLGPLATALKTSISLPMAIDLGTGFAQVSNLCNARDSTGNETATFAVSAPIANVCIGNVTSSGAFSTTSMPCGTGTTNPPLLQILGLATVNTPISLNVLPNQSSMTLSEGQNQSTPDNGLALGTTLNSVVSAITASLLGAAAAGTPSQPLSSQTLAQTLLKGNTLSAVSTALNTSLTSLQTLATNASPSTTSGALVQGAVGSAVGALLTGITSGVTSLLGSVGQIVGGLVSGLIGPCGILSDSQTCLNSKLSGSSGGTPNTILGLLGIVTQALQPTLDSVGSDLAKELTTLGIQLGVTDVTLMHLDCVGGGVRLIQ